MLKLKTLRKECGLTQRQVAEKLGISQNNYSYIENGKVKISEEYIDILCSLFACSKDYLLGKKEERKKNFVAGRQKELAMVDFILTGEDRFDYYNALDESEKSTFIFYLLHGEKSLRETKKTLSIEIKKSETIMHSIESILFFHPEYAKKENDEQ